MIAALSMAFLAFASPLKNADDYIWTTPNIPSNIAGVVAGPLARTEDVAYIHEAIAERRVLGGLGTGASIFPVTVVRTPDRPITPDQALANGWHAVSTGLVDGVVNVLAYRETVTNWPKAGGVDTWRMNNITFKLPGGNWLDPSNDVSSMTMSRGASFTNCFSTWHGFMQETNITLRGLAWRPEIIKIINRLDAYKHDVIEGGAQNYDAIYEDTSEIYGVMLSPDGKSISLVPNSGNGTITITNGMNMGFSASRRAYKEWHFYLDENGNRRPCGGSPISYMDTRLVSTVGSVAGGQRVIASVHTPFCFSTGGVWRVNSAKAVAIVRYEYRHERILYSTGYENVKYDYGYVCVPVKVTSITEDQTGNLVATIDTPLHTIVSTSVEFVDLPKSDSGFIPPMPQYGNGEDEIIFNDEYESLDASIESFFVIVSVKPLTTIQE